jgi:hypothetical protein
MLARRTNLIPESIGKALQDVPARAVASQRGLWFEMTREEREAFVRQVWVGSGTVSDAADSVGCNTPALSGVAMKLKLPPRRGGALRHRRRAKAFA